MAVDQTTKIAFFVIFFGLLSFTLGILAENKKPLFGHPDQQKGLGVVICQFPSDPTIALGALSVVALVLAAIVGHVAVYFPYKGKSVPSNVLFQSPQLLAFVIIAEAVTVLAMVLMIWATVTEGLHRSRNIHHDLEYECPTAKTGVFGGAAFLALDSALFWLVCQMLTTNARSDYFDEDDPQGEYGKVSATDLDVTRAGHQDA